MANRHAKCEICRLRHRPGNCQPRGRGKGPGASTGQSMLFIARYRGRPRPDLRGAGRPGRKTALRGRGEEPYGKGRIVRMRDCVLGIDQAPWSPPTLSYYYFVGFPNTASNATIENLFSPPRLRTNLYSPGFSTGKGERIRFTIASP